MFESFKKAENWNFAVLSENKKIKDAIINLNYTTLKIIIVVNKKNFLLGTITDGDIRRGFLNKLNLNDPIKRIINYKPKFVYERDLKNKKFKSKNFSQIDQIPIVNKLKKVVGLLTRSEPSDGKFIDNDFVIMAGGKGTRLLPLTKDIPKPMLKINGKPILQTIMETASNKGFYNFHISINYLKDIIKEYFSINKNFNINISYIEEKKPMGTAGCLRLWRNDNKPMVLVNGDVLCDIDYKSLIDFHEKNNSFATMVVKSKISTYPFGVTENSGYKLKNIIEKPQINFNVNVGIYVLDHGVKKFIKKNFFDMTELFQNLIKSKKRVFIYPIFENWEDISDRFEK